MTLQLSTKYWNIYNEIRLLPFWFMLGFLLWKSWTHFEAPWFSSLINRYHDIIGNHTRAKKAAVKQHHDVVKIKFIPVDLLDSQKSTMKLRKLSCCKQNRLSRSFRHREIDNGMPLYTLLWNRRKRRTRNLEKLKVLMLRYELKERAKTEDQLRIYNFDEVKNKKELTALTT